MDVCKFCEQSIANDFAVETDESPAVCGPCNWLLSESNSDQWVRPMTESDLELVLSWRSNPQVYQYFRSQDSALEWEQHVQWYHNRSDSRHDYIIHFENRRVGCITLQSDGYVSIYLGDFSARGQGVAKKALNWMTRAFREDREIKAEIYNQNTGSMALFEICGFKKIDSNGDWYKYKYTGEGERCER